MLPRDYLATGPAEVATVVYLDWSSTLVGHYNGNASLPAYDSRVDVVVVDLPSSSVVGTASFTNQPPGALPAGVTGETVAQKPEDQVVRYLLGLPGLTPPDRTGIGLGVLGIVLVVAVLGTWWFIIRPLRAPPVPGQEAAPMASAGRITVACPACHVAATYPQDGRAYKFRCPQCSRICYVLDCPACARTATYPVAQPAPTMPEFHCPGCAVTFRLYACPSCRMVQKAGRGAPRMLCFGCQRAFNTAARITA